MSDAPISIERVTVLRGRMRIDVRIADHAPLQTNDDIAMRALDSYPQLAVHSCINKHGPTFGDVIANTSLPHLMEHLIIAEQASMIAARGPLPDVTFVGTTEPTGNRTAAIEVNFNDDMIAIEALRRALDFANMIVLENA